ncbi:protein translocase subunit SecD [Vibrio nigripulchritudo]|uniref:protein translocase subunit SecD n=1 Tax=Vibrio nigripulchritudo TaxID=28173 RepID=UPI0005F9E876|nr:protein translocase subunit SecD [Vibrio nigripulchritudo]KJY78708.1 preprotein translocase subunit SecD [Vibrio nigripulchritudo]
MSSPRTRAKAPERMNHYAIWKYVVLLTAIVLLALSALPSWYGDKPALIIDQPKADLSIEQVSLELKHHNIPVREITETGNQMVVLLESEHDQANAKAALLPTLGAETQTTLAYQSVAPVWLTQMGFQPVDLGLDLRGGVQFLLKVDVDQALNEKQQTLADDIRTTARKLHIRGIQISHSVDHQITVTTQTEDARSEIGKAIQEAFPQWQQHGQSNKLVLSMPKQSIDEFAQQTLKQNLTILRSRIEELGITEASVQRQGDDYIRIELPGVQDPSQAKSVIGATASLAFHEVETESSKGRIFSALDEDGNRVRLVSKPVVKGEHIVDARAGIDEMGRAVVNISLDLAGGGDISDFSATHVGKPMATLFSEYVSDAQGNLSKQDKVISVATIQSQLGTRFQITGAGSMQDAQELALLLRAGSLTAPVTIVEEQAIGASLGAENIENGFSALALGMGLTLAFMAVWYRRLGWVANLALLSNMVCLLGLIALIPGAVLTLPGIAGLVLTVGMAVDTNVLIFERIKDKLGEGRSFAQSINLGFNSAVSTIMDANITTLITAVVLYAIGNGPVQGFALTLGLGILTSMFTGIFLSRAIINLIWGQDARRDVRV